jgi:hypothetical protein
MRVLALFVTLSLVQVQAPPNVTGIWEWKGSAGWQRIEMTFKTDGSKLTGVIRMGPGGSEPASPADFWQYFFDPVDFKIFNGKVDGNQIHFEQNILRFGVPPQQGRGGFQSAVRQTFENRFLYHGVVQGDQIVMTREMVAVKKDPASLGHHKVSFILSRVK